MEKVQRAWAGQEGSGSSNRACALLLRWEGGRGGRVDRQGLQQGAGVPALQWRRRALRWLFGPSVSCRTNITVAFQREQQTGPRGLPSCLDCLYRYG